MIRRRGLIVRGLIALVISTAALVSAAPAVAATPGFFGVNSTFQPDSTDLARMGQARVGNLRMPFGWEELEPSPGVYNFSNFDRVVAGAAAQGIQVRPFIFGTPPWARDCTGIPAFYCDRVTPMRSAVGRQRWPLALKALASRYGTRGSFWTDHNDAYSPPYDPITVWQLWNEPNSATYMRPKPTPKAYFALLSSGSRAIRDVDSNAKILLAGLFGTPPNGMTMWRFLDRLYRFKHVKSLFDAVALHPYSPNIRGIAYQLRNAARVLRAHRARRTTVYLTELGWGSGTGSSNLYKGLRGQAQTLMAAFKFALKNRKRYHIGGVDWFSWRDIPENMSGNCALCTSFGLLYLDHTPKPSLASFTHFTGGG
jgi:polysaccharide biosynthesis protein PslG